MSRSVLRSGALVLVCSLGLVATADAEVSQRRVRHAAPEGHQIVVHARESFLTLGTSAPVGYANGYALDTIASTAPFTPFVDHTGVGVMGLDRIPTNMTVPGCCRP